MSKTKVLTDEQKLIWIQLALSENVGSITFHNLLKTYRQPELALARLPVLAARGGLKRRIKLYPREEAEQQLELAEQQKITIHASCEASYPKLLASTADAPPLLWSKGNLELLNKTCLAMVGSRVASANGIFFAKQLAETLSDHNYTIVSGLALGIDTASHLGSLASGTVAMLVGGLDVIYPQRNTDLYHKIAEQGLLLAAHPLGKQIRPHYFLRRNYVMAGMSQAIIVVECRLQSGSLSAAHAAASYGREVFAVPGSPFDPRARGCNKLLREQAIMVESVDDILRELDYASPRMKAAAAQPSLLGEVSFDEEQISEDKVAAARQLVLDKLSTAPVSVDFLAHQLQLVPAVVRVILLELELAGKLERLRGDLVCRRYQAPT